MNKSLDPKSRNLLIVDDDTLTAFSLASDLQSAARSHGLTIRAFTDADMALEFIKSSPKGVVELAIVDLWMLDKKTGIEDQNKGREVIKILHQCQPTSRILVLSAHIDDDARQQLTKSGVDSLKKPAGFAEIGEKLGLIEA